MRSEAERLCEKDGRLVVALRGDWYEGIFEGDSIVGIAPVVRRETGTSERRDWKEGRMELAVGFGAGAFRSARGSGVDACESPCESIMTHSEPFSVCILFAGR